MKKSAEKKVIKKNERNLHKLLHSMAISAEEA